MMGTSLLVKSDIEGLTLLRRGKVRDVYDLGEKLLIVSTDRLSAFDHVLPTPVPDKGRILTQVSAFWFEKTRAIVPSHFLTADLAEVQSALPKGVRLDPEDYDGRVMLVWKAQRFDAEIEVLHVLEPPRYIAPDLVLHIEEGGPQTLGQFLRARAMRDMEQLLGSVPQRGEKRARPRIEMGDIAQTIANIAAEPGCDLVVMGTHGRQGLGHLLLGSVAVRFPQTKLEWNSAKLQFDNVKEANQFVRRRYRKGWEVAGL